MNWLNFLNRYGLNGILCDDLGLGKTLQTICILAGSHHEIHANRSEQQLMVLDDDKAEVPLSLVICPPTLCKHWLQEVRQFAMPADLQPVVYFGNAIKRQR